jgi:hypothetical protein
MAKPSHEKLRIIHFEGEVLPHWAQLLELAAALCPVPEETRLWFVRFVNARGPLNQLPAEDIRSHAETLRTQLRETQSAVLRELESHRDDDQAATVFAAWMYALDTIILQTTGKTACRWFIEGLAESPPPDDGSGGGDITLRRV